MLFVIQRFSIFCLPFQSDLSSSQEMCVYFVVHTRTKLSTLANVMSENWIHSPINVCIYWRVSKPQ